MLINPENLIFLDPPPIAQFRGDRFDSVQYAIQAWRSQITEPEDALSASIVLDDILDAEEIG